MNESSLQLAKAPIIEAVLDIDCDLPLSVDQELLEKSARDALRDRYPKLRKQSIQEHVWTHNGIDAPEMQMMERPGALQFLTEDERQLVQFRPNGFSFNRLAPYGSLDDYLPEIESAWRLFEELAQPVMIRKVGLRMINRMLLPLSDGKLVFSDFLQVAPSLPATGLKLGLVGFLEQHLAIDEESLNRVNIVKTSEAAASGSLPVILDIDAFHPCDIPPPEWPVLLARIESLRNLKNRVFQHTLTAQCLNLFSPVV
ncbi:MAG TPA: TIGR04255 family protein [Chthoniobacteraceae bacterium]|jgi:uncharacterized protein (TIGR04255 family)|nr:TIGR04255 family protein [Chthoniobacteraceae bacterium]